MDTPIFHAPGHEGHEAHHRTIAVHVRYLGARHRFEQAHASATETLTTLKERVLELFKLQESAGQPGGKVYYFAHDGKELSNLSLTIGEVAGEHRELRLDLVEQFQQG